MREWGGGGYEYIVVGKPRCDSAFKFFIFYQLQSVWAQREDPNYLGISELRTVFAAMGVGGGLARPTESDNLQ